MQQDDRMRDLFHTMMIGKRTALTALTDCNRVAFTLPQNSATQTQEITAPGKHPLPAPSPTQTHRMNTEYLRSKLWWWWGRSGHETKPVGVAGAPPSGPWHWATAGLGLRWAADSSNGCSGAARGECHQLRFPVAAWALRLAPVPFRLLRGRLDSTVAATTTAQSPPPFRPLFQLPSTIDLLLKNTSTQVEPIVIR